MKIEKRFLNWLRPEGIEYLKEIIKKHGTVFAVWNEGRIPHSTHFREGMQIRNWMRQQPEFKNKEDEMDHWFDDNWVEFTEKCLKIKE